MSFTFEVHTPLDPATVLTMIKQDLAEWRESVLPSEVRQRGIIRILGALKGNRFTMRTWPNRRGYVTVELIGLARPGNDGGSIIDATVRPRRSVSQLALPIFGLIFGAIVASPAFAAVFAAVGCIAVLAREPLVSPQNPDAAYLAQRLRSLLAGHVNAPVDSASE